MIKLLTTLSQAVLYGILYYVLIKFAQWLFVPLLCGSQFHDLPGPPSNSWVMGNLGQLFNAKGLPFHQSLVDLYGGMVRVYGFFGDEQLYIADPHALQSIIIKDHDAFEETTVFTETNKVIFGPGLVATTGEQHARQRRVVKPILAVPHLRRLTPIFYQIADKLADVLSAEIEKRGTSSHSTVMDMSAWICRVALESVGKTVLGYSFDPLDSPHNNPYTSAIKELIPKLFSLSLVRQFAPFLSKLGPPSFRRKLVEWTPHKAVQRVKEMSDVMHETAQKILQEKREAIFREDSDLVKEEVTEGKDIISILLRANEEAKTQNGEQLTDLELTGQMTVLVFGAQDTTSSCLSRILHLLAQRPDIQDKIRAEIQAGRCEESNILEHSGRLDYDVLSKLPWLDAVLKETLRLYPPVPFVRRSAVKETVLPYSRSQDGSDMASVKVPVGTTVFVSISGSNRLESVWGPDAKEWKPERWLIATPEFKISTLRLPGIYSGMMSFLGGDRSCIGYKFAQIEMKIILSTLLSRFKFSCTQDEIVWNLSQIISPSVCMTNSEGLRSESKGLPLIVKNV
ncbi:cytochrome P450 [Flammula alnicola]|nr:cytochrome P450 [Flammula alnicola]